MVALTDSPFEAAAPTNETKAERKARLRAEKAAAKQAKADAKAAKKLAKQEGTPAAPRRRDEERLEAKLERYRQLRASVRNRRIAYGLIITLAIVVFVGTALDIVFNGSDLKWVLLPAYVILFVWGIVLLFSRRRHLQEVAELEAMQRTYLECDNCRSVFQFGELNFGNRRRVGFTCPVCAEESALPGPDAQPVERVLPDARVLETTYACGNCKEQLVVGTFGTTPRESVFRACPNCGVTGKVALA